MNHLPHLLAALACGVAACCLSFAAGAASYRRSLLRIMEAAKKAQEGP